MKRTSAEAERLFEDRQRKRYWRRWGPYVSEREWGTVREDYSGEGDAWNAFPFQDAAWRAYRWGEDGIAGLCDNHQRLCFAFSFWNEKDPILKERLFGLNGSQGNHGEDVKEYYAHLDNVPSHAYMKSLYRYPQGGGRLDLKWGEKGSLSHSASGGESPSNFPPRQEKR